MTTRFYDFKRILGQNDDGALFRDRRLSNVYVAFGSSSASYLTSIIIIIMLRRYVRSSIRFPYDIRTSSRKITHHIL